MIITVPAALPSYSVDPTAASLAKCHRPSVMPPGRAHRQPAADGRAELARLYPALFAAPVQTTSRPIAAIRAVLDAIAHAA